MPFIIIIIFIVYTVGGPTDRARALMLSRNTTYGCLYTSLWGHARRDRHARRYGVRSYRRNLFWEAKYHHFLIKILKRIYLSKQNKYNF